MKEIGFSKYCITNDGKVFSLIAKRFLSESLMSSGYKKSHIKNDSGKLKNLSIHRSVALMYLDNKDNKPFVNHIDENKLNNHFTNLEWVTDSENKQSWHDNNPDKHSSIKEYTVTPKACKILKERPELGGRSFTKDNVNEICSLYQEGYRISDINKMTGFRCSVIGHLVKNNYPKWCYVVSSYSFEDIKKVERMSREAVSEICAHLTSGKGVMEVSRVTGICRSAIGEIKNRRSYVKVSCNYTW